MFSNFRINLSPHDAAGGPPINSRLDDPQNQDLAQVSTDPRIKRYANDPAKAKSRELLRANIHAALLPIKFANELRVLCLAGIDCSEIFEVYDPLGIPRKNIVVIERDLEIAKVIEKRAPGVVVFNNSVNEVVDSYPISSDIISFDYTGPVTTAQLAALRVIADRSKHSRLVVHQANLARRDAMSDPIYRAYASATTEVATARIQDDVKREKAEIDRVQANFDAVREAGEDYSEYRSRSYKLAIGYAVASGVSQTGHRRMLEYLIGERGARAVEREMLPRIKAEYPNLNGSPYGESYEPLSETSRRWSLVFERELRLRIERIGLSPQNLLMFAHEAMLYSLGRPNSFHIGGTYSYSYISESGSPMYGEILTFYRRPEFEASAKRFISFLSPSRSFRVGIFKHNFTDFTQRLFPPHIGPSSTERQFLGNSARPILNKEVAIEGFRNGKSIDDLKREYRGWSRLPLAQWKAHFTMGTYDSISEEKTETVPDSKLDSPEEALTKSEAVELLAAGIPADEIAAVYPSAFTIGQLRAFKAHLTMGTYK